MRMQAAVDPAPSHGASVLQPDQYGGTSIASVFQFLKYGNSNNELI
jgi:hypothetical protein